MLDNETLSIPEYLSNAWGGFPAAVSVWQEVPDCPHNNLCPITPHTIPPSPSSSNQWIHLPAYFLHVLPGVRSYWDYSAKHVRVPEIYLNFQQIRGGAFHESFLSLSFMASIKGTYICAARKSSAFDIMSDMLLGCCFTVVRMRMKITYGITKGQFCNKQSAYILTTLMIILVLQIFWGTDLPQPNLTLETFMIVSYIQLKFFRSEHSRGLQPEFKLHYGTLPRRKSWSISNNTLAHIESRLLHTHVQGNALIQYIFLVSV